MNAAAMYFPELEFHNGERRLVFKSDQCAVSAHVGARALDVWVEPIYGDDDVHLDAKEARWFAAALLAAADASEATP